jgi:hypothetical protein
MRFSNFSGNKISASVVINRYVQTTPASKNMSGMQASFSVAQEMAESLG